MTVQQIIDINPGEQHAIASSTYHSSCVCTAVAQKLSKTEEIECKTCDKFTEEISKYISSLDNCEEGEPQTALWPLIREVHIRCHADVLSSGAVLVDLPGIADANAARNNIAQGYLKHAQRIFIVAPITRAVDDGTAQSTFLTRTQLL